MDMHSVYNLAVTPHEKQKGHQITASKVNN